MANLYLNEMLFMTVAKYFRMRSLQGTGLLLRLQVL